MNDVLRRNQRIAGSGIKLIVLTLMCTIALYAYAGASNRICKNAIHHEDKLILEYEFSELNFEYDGGYQIPHIEDLHLHNRPGEPILPVFVAEILIPQSKSPSRIRVFPDSVEEITLQYQIKPGQGAFRRLLKKKPEPVEPQPNIYNLSSTWPGYYFKKVAFQSKRGLRVFLLNLFPVQYIPASGQITFSKRIRVEIELQKATTDSTFYPTRDLRRKLKSQLDNPSVLDSYSVNEYYKHRAKKGIQYLVITSPYLANPNNYLHQKYTFQRLCSFRRKQGIRAQIFTTDRIYDNYPGEDSQAKIRNFLKHAYEAWGTEYVLLGGNKDIIPVRMFHSDRESIPCDLYYGCVDPPTCSFDGNGNGRYGERTDGINGEEVDLYAEIYVGRAAVTSTEEVANFVRKTIQYEKTRDEYMNYALFGGGYLGFGGIQEFTKPFAELIRHGSDLYGFATRGIENSLLSGIRDLSVYMLYDQDWYDSGPGPDYDPDAGRSVQWNWHTDGWSAHDDLLPLLNQTDGQFPPQLIYISNHGDINLGMVRLYTREAYNDYPTLYSSLEFMKNTKSFFFYDDSCWIGSLEHPEYLEYGRCFAEIITTMKHGAFACIANSRDGWGSEADDLNSPSTHLTREFFDAGQSFAITEMEMLS